MNMLREKLKLSQFCRNYFICQLFGLSNNSDFLRRVSQIASHIFLQINYKRIQRYIKNDLLSAETRITN